MNTSFIQSLLSALASLLSSFKPTPSHPSRIQDLSLITQWEGLRLKAYQDTGGVWTIGYGHTKTAKPGMVITEEQAIKLKKQDIAWVEDVLNSTVKVPLKQHQYDALGSFVFNIGGTQFRNSTMLEKLNDHDYLGAANEFRRWVYDNGKKIKGLENRREAEELYFLYGKR